MNRSSSSSHTRSRFIFISIIVCHGEVEGGGVIIVSIGEDDVNGEINVGEGGGVIIVCIGEDDVNGEINVGEGGRVIIVCIGEDDVNGEINVGEGGVWNKTGGGNVSATQEAGGGITVSCKVSISQRA